MNTRFKPLSSNYSLFVFDPITKKWDTLPQLCSQPYVECLQDAERTARFSTAPMRFSIQYDMPAPASLQVVIEDFTLEPNERLLPSG